MKFTTAFVAIFFAGALAIPTGSGSDGGSFVPCPGTLYTETQCCATDVLGLADLDCHNPSEVPNSASHFAEVCAEVGQRARCCVLPVLGLAVLCQAPDGIPQ